MLPLSASRHRLSVLLVTVCAAGCATSPDVKLASTEMTAALSELRAANRMFRNLYIAEIDRVRAEMGRAIVARSVVNALEDLSDVLDSTEWQEKFRQRGMIALSREIEAARDQATGRVKLLMELETAPGDTAEAVLSRFFAEEAEKARISARSLREAGAEAEARVLEARADELEQLETPADRIVTAYMVAIIELGAMTAEATRNLQELDDLVNMLRETHSAVHDWVMTDVKPSGAEVARVLDKHADKFGLGGAPTDGSDR